MVVFDLEQTHMVRGVTIAKPEKWRVNYKRNSDDLLTWLSEGTSASQVNNDLVPRLGAADQQIAVGRGFERFRLVTDGASNQPAFAAMTDPCPARPPHGNIAGLGQFEQALVRRIPMNDEATASERDLRPRAGRPGRKPSIPGSMP